MITGLIGMAIAITFLSLALGIFMTAEQPQVGLRFTLGGLAVAAITVICITILALNGVK